MAVRIMTQYDVIGIAKDSPVRGGKTSLICNMAVRIMTQYDVIATIL